MTSSNCLSTSLITALLPLVVVALGAFLTWYFNQRIWDRQKRWEMKREVVDEAVRTLGELELALMNLHIYYSIRMPDPEDAKARALIKRQEARKHFDLCSQKYYRVMFSVDLAVGEVLAKRLSEYFQHVGQVALQILNGDTESFGKPETKQSLANETKEIIQTARKVLNIKNAGQRAFVGN